MQYKIILIGATNVGKTSIVKYYMTENVTNVYPTVGVSTCEIKREIDHNEITYKIWDTAGQEQYKSLGTIYYNGAHAAIAVFDVTNQDSLHSLEEFVRLYKETANNSNIFFVGNKTDLKPKIPREDMEECTYLRPLFFTSTKTGESINEMFECVFDSFNNINTEEIPAPKPSSKDSCC